MPTTIHQALAAAQAEMRSAQKSGKNTFDKYEYAKLEDFMDVAKPVLAKHGLAITFGTDEIHTLDDRSTKNGGVEHAVRVRVVATLIHESGATIAVYGYGEGQDRADKASYKAITGARKYAIAGLLAIPTTDDPEADETVGLARGKVATATGETKSKIPAWTADQSTEAGAIRQAIINLGGDPADAEVKLLKTRMKYDDPQDVLDAMFKLRAKWEDIAEAAREARSNA